MKTPEEIKAEITRLMGEIAVYDEEYHKMHQIDMLSSEGNSNRSNANKAIGKVHALRWVLNL